MTRIVLLSLLALPFAAAFLLPGGRTPSPRHLDRDCGRGSTALAGSFYGEQRRYAESTRDHTGFHAGADHWGISCCRMKEQAQQEAQQAWAARFQELLAIQGQELCVVSYEGYLRTGSRGAVVVSTHRGHGPR